MARALLAIVLASQLPNATATRWQEDLAALSRELPAKHEDAFHTVSREAFNAAVMALNLRIPSLGSHDVAVELARLVAMTGDGHTELQLLQPAVGFHVLPVVFYQYEEGLYIVAASALHTDVLGARVHRIGNDLAGDAFKKVTPLLSGDTDVEHLHSAPAYLACPEILNALGIIDATDRVDLEVLTRDGQQRRVTLAAVSAGAVGPLTTMRAAARVADPLAASRPGILYWFTALPDTRAMFYQINASMDQDGKPSLAQVTRDLFKAFDAANATHLVVDIRNNNGGNIARNRELIKGIADRPALRDKGRVFLMTGRRTFSAGVDIIMEARRVAAPTLAGESPRGLAAKPGNRETLTLPHSRIVIDYSQKIDSYAFRSSRRRPITVDIPAPPRFDAAIAGRDPALEAIVRILSGK